MPGSAGGFQNFHGHIWPVSHIARGWTHPAEVASNKTHSHYGTSFCQLSVLYVPIFLSACSAVLANVDSAGITTLAGGLPAIDTGECKHDFTCRAANSNGDSLKSPVTAQSFLSHARLFKA